VRHARIAWSDSSFDATSVESGVSSDLSCAEELYCAHYELPTVAAGAVVGSVVDRVENFSGKPFDELVALLAG
jgi:hypothetical protein